MKHLLLILCAIAASAASLPARADDSVARGEYLTTILGCGGCHTEGALMGAPTGKWLAGSKVGVAYSEDSNGQPNGVVFPTNLTSDKITGLGNWSQDDIVRFLNTGKGHDGMEAIPVMPWPNYRVLKPEDIEAIAAYLKSLPPVAYAVPADILPGAPVDQPYVRIGVYLFKPDPQ